MSLNIIHKPFEALTPSMLYDIMDIRLTVFVMEQEIMYVDTDYKDQHSIHYMLYDGDQLVSYLRLIKPGFKYDEYTIGRVATYQPYRQKGYATMLIKACMNDIKGSPIRISGQAYLKEYYEKLGFVTVKGPYLEEEILHYEMLFDNKK